MNSMDRFCLKGLLFFCLPLLLFTLLLQHVEDRELAQVERSQEDARCNPSSREGLWNTVGCKGEDFVVALTADVRPVNLWRR